MLDDGHTEDSVSGMHLYTYEVDSQKMYKVSGYIGTTIGTCMIAYFDSSENYIGYEVESGGKSHKVIDYIPNIPMSASYIRIEGRTGGSSYQDPILEEYITAFDVIDDRVGVIEAEIDDINGRVDNIEAEIEATNERIDNIGGKYTEKNPENTISGYIIDGTTGELISSISDMMINEYPIDAEGEYIADGYIGATLGTVMIAYYNEGGYISGEIYSEGSGTAHKVIDYKLTIPVDATIVRVVGRTTKGSIYQKSILKEFVKVLDYVDYTINNINERIDNIGQSFKPRMYNPVVDLKKDALKILDIGNSYTEDAQHYLS